MIPSTRTPPDATPPDRSHRSRSSWSRRVGTPVALLLGAFILGGCNVPTTFGAFRGVTVQAKDEFKLWQAMLIAGIIVAGIVYILIFWAAIVYRRRTADHFPHQFHSNTPIEIIYTVIPILIVAGIFWVTVLTENNVDAISNAPSEIVHVDAFQWGWQFTYDSGSNVSQGVVIRTAAQPHLLALPSTSSEYPQLVLPENETVRIVLTSNDTIHGFYIPEFNFSRYAQPGVTNVFDFTPTTAGVFTGQCSQYCGLYHSEMIFNVRVESTAKFQQWLTSTQTSQAQGAA